MTAKGKSSFNELITQKKPTLVDFHATWCGPCKMMSPILNSLSKNIGDKAKIIKIDIDKNQKLASNLGIKSVPTFVLYKSGKIVWRKSGMQTEKVLLEVINSHI